ncbi:unnamed protein product [Periconia digitata]|uniref:Uncharacterized protein n=1 Tax=Periconia digitata TaxID=1303443 RepID=A0A9W4XQU2_9PLEO|nr:unnamed protein product [Periconia digitata]
MDLVDNIDRQTPVRGMPASQHEDDVSGSAVRIIRFAHVETGLVGVGGCIATVFGGRGVSVFVDACSDR